jgi:hypothetical protein
MLRSRLPTAVAVGLAGLGLLAPAAPARAAGTVPTFGPPVSSVTGAAPTSVLAGDLDGDGVTDLAVTTGTGELDVLLGNGTGSFPSRVGYPVGGSPTALLAAPLRSGGPPDVAVTTGNSVVLLQNDGVGTFTPGRVLAVGTAPSSVAAADVDGDGDLDLLTSNAGSDDVSVLLGDGTGRFATLPSVPTGTAPSGLDVTDLDRDGHLDVVTSNAGSDDVSILLGNGDGSFRPGGTVRTGGGGPSSVLVADLDDDAQPDVVVTDGATDDVVVLLANGDGTLAPPRSATTSTPVGPGQQPVAAAVSDVNGDGHPDVAVLNATSQTVGVLLGDGTGDLDPTTTVGAGSAPSWLVSADVDADERPDLVVSAAGSDSVVARLNTTPFPLSSPAPGPTSSSACGRRAVLVGQVAATGYRTTWSFTYRQPGGPTQRTPARVLDPDDDPVVVSAAVTVTRPAARLRYRLVVTSAGQRVSGPWQVLHVRPRCR